MRLVPNEAWLSAGLASGVGELVEPWTTITRPAGVGLVLTLTAKSALAPAARDAAVQVNVAERGLPLYCLLHCQPAGACTDAVAVIVLRSEESRVGKECVRTCRNRRSTYT